MIKTQFKLYYWPIPFRRCFITYLFAYCDIPFLLECRPEKIEQLKNLSPKEQTTPFMGPPILEDLHNQRSISQMPAIVHYISRELGLYPKEPFAASSATKVLMDCNDVLMEICRYNGSTMWTHEQWQTFQTERLPRWMHIFEASLEQDFFGSNPVSFADISVYALFGNMIRCLPELEKDLLSYAPQVYVHCHTIGKKSSLANYIEEEQKQYGSLYCGGQIEASIREMLALDSEKK